MTKQWFMKRAVGDETLVGKQFGIDPKLARLLLNRGLHSAAAFSEYLRADASCMHDPHELKDADVCCAFLLSAVREGKKIRIIGDYDVDGVTSTTIYLKMLRSLGADVDYVIPHRIYDGYGIRMYMIEEAAADGVDVLLTCDTGIAAYEETVRAKELGMTVLITDHHEVPFEEINGQKIYKLPPADAVVNPKQEDCPYPQKGICGAVVALKVCRILCEKTNRQLPDELIELAALATVCDVMDLTGENRALVKKGLSLMQNSSNLGLRTLISLTVNRTVTSYHLGFVIGPCFNASGRIETAKEAVELLMAENPAQAEALAVHLRDLNEERKQMTEQNLEDAMAQAEEYEDDRVLVLYLPECHESLAGIVAGRVKEQTNKPTFVLTNAAGEVDASLAIKGSGRSIEAYSMYDRLTEVSDLLTRFGGHPMAAGLSLPYEHVEEFRRRLNENSGLTEQDLVKRVAIDMELLPDEVTIPFVESLAILEPFGTGNRKPLFAARGMQIRRAAVLGQNQNVLRLTFQQPGGRMWHNAVLFGTEEIRAWQEECAAVFGPQAVWDTLAGKDAGIVMDLAYEPEIDSWGDRVKVQFVVREYRVRR